MKKNIFQLLAIVFLLSFHSCQDDQNIFIVDDNIGLLHPDKTEAKVYLSGDIPYHVYVIKSGTGKGKASVSISISEEILSNYNEENGTSYELLPTDCYNITQKTIDFGSTDYRKSFEIDWNIDALSSLDASLYAIPVQINIENSNVNISEERLTTIIIPQIVKPALGFTISGLYSPPLYPTIYEMDDREIYIPVETNYPSDTNVEFEIEVDPSLIDEYNTQNSTSYQMLPEEAFSLEKNKWSISGNLNEGFVKILYKNKALIPEPGNYLFGNYAIPLRISSVSKYDVAENSSYILYPITFQPSKIDKKEWKIIDYNSSSKDDEIAWIANLDWGVEKLIDGNLNTFWGSRWTTPKPLPYYFVIDMAKEYTLFRMAYENPIGAEAWRGDAKAGHIEVSLDNENWTKVAEWSAPDRATRTITFDIPAPSPTARYVRFVVTDAFTPLGGGSQMNIAELDIWGI